METTLDKDTKRANVALAVLYAMFTLLAIPAPRIVQMLGPKYVVWALQAGCDVIPGKVVVGEECVWRLLTVVCGVWCVVCAGVHVARVSMLVGGLPYVLICLANISPQWATTVPAFGLVGVGAALLWTGQGVRGVVCAARCQATP